MVTKKSSKKASTKKSPKNDDLKQHLYKVKKASEKELERGQKELNKFLKDQEIEHVTFAAFAINLLFSIFEFIGGSISGSISILSDAVHDLGDSISIGAAHFMSKKSRHAADKSFTFGYSRYLVYSAFVSSSIVIIGSGLMICFAFFRLLSEATAHPFWMIVVSLFGLVMNSLAAFYPSRKNATLRVTNHYLIEDVIGWIVVLAGSILIALTGWTWLDPVMSISISIFLILNAFKSYRKSLDLFLEKVPDNISVDTVRFQVMSIPHIENVHHVHIWSLDGKTYCATLHAVVDGAVIDGILLENSVESPHNIKAQIRKALSLLGITEVTIEIETDLERCKIKKH